jgi:hypothetical protein
MEALQEFEGWRSGWLGWCDHKLTSSTGGLNLEEAVVWEHENLGVDGNGEAPSGWNHEGESRDAMLRDGLPGSSDEAE